jgi:DNA-binding winged helix-turn-helix (wHTH) protein
MGTARWCAAGASRVGGVRGEFRGKCEGEALRARFGSFSVDSDTRRLERAGADIHLTPKAFDLLGLLIEAAPRVISKSELHERFWPGSFVSDATLVGLVKELRRALADQRRGALIRTVHRVGYAFSGRIEPEQERPPTAPEVTHWIVQGSSRVPLREGANVIGRDPDSAVWVDVAGVSRRHACVVVDGRSATLEDLGSKNGTMRGDQLVTTPVTLCDADRIQIASVVLVFRASTADASTDTQLRRAPRKRT